jgi:hypothetical protein
MPQDYFFSPASSFIVGANYTTETKVLQVKFSNGETWAYSDVDEGVWTGFKASESKGRYYHANIRDIYSAEQV